MARENFFILLELPFNPPSEDVAELKAAIQKKHREWSRQLDDSTKGSTALHYMELVPEMEAVLLDPESRAQEAAEARVLRDQILPAFRAEIQLLEVKGYVHPREVANLTEKYSPYGFSSRQIRSHIKAPLTDTPPKKQDGFVDVPALSHLMVTDISAHLKVLGMADLYAFLKTSPEVSAANLSSMAQKQLHTAFHAGGKSGVTTATQQLAELSVKVFENSSTKKSYDTYLGISKYPELNNLIQQEAGNAGFIRPDTMMRLINFGVSTYTESVISLEEYIRSYCNAYHISVDMVAPQITCPNCNALNPRGTTYCHSCAAPLEGNCPQCGTLFSDGAKVCSNCSFSVGQMGKALPYVEQAKLSLNENNWSAAAHAIQYIQQYWPGHPEILELSQWSERVKELYVSRVRAIESAMNEKRFYAGKELAADAAERRIPVPKELVRRITDTILEFEEHLSRVKSSGNVSFDSLNKLAGHMSDSLELSRMMTQYPPEPPIRFTARPNGEEVPLNWGKSSSSGQVSYVVVRKENSVPLTAFDGSVVYEGNEHSFTDTDIPPLKSYFYSVFSRRSGTYSEMGAVSAAPVRIVPELQNLKITPADRAAQLTWSPSEYLKEVRIWRKTEGGRPQEPGDGDLLETTRLDGYTDMNLKNDTDYWYYIVAIYYTKDGGYITSTGVTENVTPHKLTAPIDYFSVALSQDNPDLYFINWETTPRDEVILFQSQTRPPHLLGQMVETKDLLRNYNRVLLENQTSTNAQFHLRVTGGTYIFPVSVSGRFGSIGGVYYLTNVQNVTHLSYDIIDSSLFINFRWPAGSFDSISLAWRRDTFPSSITQKGTNSLVCTREQYDLDAGVKIPDISQGVYYITLYTTYEGQDGQPIYSTGENLLVDNSPAKEFFYSIKYARNVFSSTRTITVTIEADHVFNLPNALIVGKEGRLPLSISDGEALFEIEPEDNIAGSISYEYKSTKLPPNLYTRLFFFDDSFYQKLRPISSKDLRLT